MAYFAASTDTVETNRRFAESLDLDYPILSDPSRTVARAYGVVGPVLPWACRWTFYIGLDGRLLALDRKVSARTAGQDVAGRLAALGVRRRPA